MKAIIRIVLAAVALASMPVMAQRAQTFGEYTVHYNALNSSLIAPEIATAYGIRRSDSRALLNISVLENNPDGTTTAVRARVTASGRNLTGQTRTIDMREISDGLGAVYYIGELTVRNRETFDFTIEVLPAGHDAPLELSFRQQFYTE